ncbi:MAG TPA: hypothetical protein VFM98_20660 [Ramlibacter sp.]|nr:hypothetical protein [Ramlibacter sp.]HET8748021.1 hypothetical protein [Ramlibacter sp.]
MASRARRIAAYAVAAVVLAGVFALYTRPDMMVSIGDMIWACFQ